MSDEICLICATDEGIFLDIFTNDKALRSNIETCLSLKLFRSKVASQKVCHKCAFELDKCSTFLGHCKSSKRQSQTTRQRVRYCCLCLEPGKPGYTHNLHFETSKIAINKIHNIFQNEITLSDNSPSICLECRYTLDVLTDLKKIYRATSSSSFESVFNGEADTCQLPKIETEVVKRKTTYVPLSKLEVVVSDDELDPPVGNKNKANNVIIAKSSSKKSSGKGKQANSASNDTKKCSVFLKDISSTLTDKKSKDLKSNNVDEYISLASDDDSDNDELSTRINLRKNSKRSFSDPENKVSNKKVKKENDELLLTKRRTRADQMSPVLNRGKRRVSETATSEVKIDSKSRTRKQIKLESPSREVKKLAKTKGKTKAPPAAAEAKKAPTEESAESEEEVITPRTTRQTRNKINSTPSSSRGGGGGGGGSSSSKNQSQKLTARADFVDEGNQAYTCTVCSANFDNRLDGKTHELTHSKMLGVVLEKVPLPKPEVKEKQQKVSFIVPESNEQRESEEDIVEKLDESIEEASSSLQDDSMTEKNAETTEKDTENLETLDESIEKNISDADEKNEEEKGDDPDSQEPVVSLDEENIPPENQESPKESELNSVDQHSVNNSENHEEDAEKSKDERNKETGEEEKLEEPVENEETDSMDARNVEELMKKIHEGQSPDRRVTEPEIVKSNNLADDLASSASEMESSELSQMSAEKVAEDPASQEPITPSVTGTDENKEKSVDRDQSPAISQAENDDESRVNDNSTGVEKINDKDSLNNADGQAEEEEDSLKHGKKQAEKEDNNECPKAQINNDNEKKNGKDSSVISLDMLQKKNSEHKIQKSDGENDKMNTDIPLIQATVDELEDKLSGC